MATSGGVTREKSAPVPTRLNKVSTDGSFSISDLGDNLTNPRLKVLKGDEALAVELLEFRESRLSLGATCPVRQASRA